MINEIIRRNIFWLLDIIKGKPIAKHYIDIKEIFENKNNEFERRNDYLDKLLKHATSTVKFYEKYNNLANLSSFPVINKRLINENLEMFISSKYNNKKLHFMTTSGSTGTPFTISQDINKRNRVLAELIYFGQLSGFEIGMRNIYFRVWSKEQKKSSWTAFKQNMVKVRINKLDETQLKDMREILIKDKKIKCIMGYASTLKLLAKYLIEKDDNPNMYNVKSIISMAEKLPEGTRKDLKKVFGCSVVSRYSNMENGILAQEATLENEFHMNYASYIFEALKIDSDEPAEVGEMGRIVITDLFNYAMPIIRYDTGDVGLVANKTRCNLNTLVFKSIDGRRADILYDTKERPISPLFDFGLDEFVKLKQYQVIQEDKKEYTLNLNGAQGVYTNEELIDCVKKSLGRDAGIKINHVKDIIVLSSGKFKQNICKYKPVKKVGNE